MTTTDVLPYLLAEVEAVEVERLSPSFVRVVLGGPDLASYGAGGPRYDQRIKLVLGPEGPVRTYTVADVRGDGEETRLVVDIAVHEAGESGPGAAWALRAVPGDRVTVIAPRRGVPFGGIQFDPPADTERLLLVGDETALPAIASILADLDRGARGHVFVEVPDALDTRDLVAPAGIELCWLARGQGDPGCRVAAAVRDHLGLEPGERTDPAEVDPELWETPTFSSSGMPLEPARPGGDRLYAWIAGESRMVTTLRRALVGELGVDRARVAFMGYWRQGVAMRS